MDLNYDDIAGILKVIDASSIDDLHLEFGGFVLDVKRNGAPHAATPTRVDTAAPATLAAPAVTQAPSTPQQHGTPAAAAPGSGQFVLTAPMLGTCYLAPAPDAPPFVREGDVVAPGAALCLIEVMKLMNTITAERAGRVASIAVANAAMVEFGMPLIVFDSV